MVGGPGRVDVFRAVFFAQFQPMNARGAGSAQELALGREHHHSTRGVCAHVNVAGLFNDRAAVARAKRMAAGILFKEVRRVNHRQLVVRDCTPEHIRHHRAVSNVIPGQLHHARHRPHILRPTGEAHFAAPHQHGAEPVKPHQFIEVGIRHEPEWARRHKSVKFRGHCNFPFRTAESIRHPACPL